MGMALLLLSWLIEGGAGVWFCYHFWTFGCWRWGADASIAGPGYVLVWVWNALVSSLYHTYAPHRHPPVLTQEQVALFFVALYIAFHLLAFVRGMILPLRERHKRGVRRQPSAREKERFERAYAAVARTRGAMADAPPLKGPRRWQVLDGGGLQARWIGWALVVDQGILESKHLPALLAHELGHYNSLDLLVRTLYLVFPPLEWSVLTLIGMPNGCGKIALYPLWMKYWRDRVFACDEYAARLGQRYQLVRALDELKWARDGGAATGGGRWLRDTPYIESRIDRLMLYRGLQQ